MEFNRRARRGRRVFLVLMFSVVPDKRASSDAEIMGLWYRVAVTKTPEIFDISKIDFEKPQRPQSDTEGTKDENNNSLCSLCALWFNLPYHKHIL